MTLNYLSPTDYLQDIEEELQQKKHTGKILFDNLLSVGNNSNRFIEANFNGLEIELTSFKVIKADDNIKNTVLLFYNENYNFVLNSILSKPLKFRIRKKLPI